MHIDEANLSNLTKLWQIYGSGPVKAATLPLLQSNLRWPHRCWIEYTTLLNSDLAELRDHTNHG